MYLIVLKHHFSGLTLTDHAWITSFTSHSKSDPFLFCPLKTLFFIRNLLLFLFFFSFLQRFFSIFLSLVCLHILLLLSPIFPFSWFFLFKPYFRSLVFWVMLDVRAVEAAGRSSAQTRGSCWVPVWGWRSLSHQQPVFPVAAAGKWPADVCLFLLRLSESQFRNHLFLFESSMFSWWR